VSNLIIDLFLGGATVFVATLIFVNAAEYIINRYKLGPTLVGAVVSPIFTSFPELVVLVYAIFVYGEISGESIGIGTVFGQPFMTSSLSYGLIGISALFGYILGKRKTLTLSVSRNLAVPYTTITLLYPLTLIPSIFPELKNLFGLLFILFFILYVITIYRMKEEKIIEVHGDLYFLRILPSKELEKMAIFAQILLSALLLYYGSSKLVKSVDILAKSIGVSSLGVALIVIPAATALPETLTALIWSFKGEDSLSIGSLVGEKVLYSTFYPGLALLLTSWILDFHAYISVVATIVVSLVFLYYILKEKIPVYALFLGFLFFILYVAITFLHIFSC